MTAVRCQTCDWKGNRKTTLAHAATLPKPCPQGHEVIVFSPPPDSVETTPSGTLIEFWEAEDAITGLKQQRHYKVDGKKLPSVTTILRVLAKDALLDWAARLAFEGKDWKDERDAAGDRGRAAHDLILRTILKERTSLADLDDEHRAYGQAAFRWLSERRPQVIEAETMVAELEYGFAGRVDLLASLKGWQGLPLVDFKSTVWKADKDGKRYPPYPENVIQLDAYALALKASGYPEPDYGLVVRLGDDGTYDEYPVLLDSARAIAVFDAYRARSSATSALTAGLPTFEWLAAA